MLKNNPSPDRRASRLSRWMAFASIALATVFALGLRSQGNMATAQDGQVAQPDGQAEATNADAENAAFPLTYAPDDAIAVFGIRPKELLSKPALKPVTQMILQTEQMAKPLGVPIDQFEQVVWSVGAREEFPPEPMLVAGMFRISGTWDLEKLKAELTPESTTGFYGGQLYLKKASGTGPAFWLADEHTLIFSDSEIGLKQAINARNLSVGREKRIPVWESAAKQTVASYFNVAQLRKLMEDVNRGVDPMGVNIPQQAFQTKLGLFGPLWRDVDTVVGGVEFGQEMNLKFTAFSKDEEAATKVNETLNAMLVLGRNMIDQNRQMIGQLPEGEQKMVGSMLTVSQEILKTLKIDREQSKVIAEAKLPPNTVNLITMALVPAVTNARVAAQRAQSMNHLKQIGLAMHNYHDTHGHFPSPVMIGEDGKTPHSWRVAILPFLDEAELHRQYRFDEPWDSEHNKKVAEQIPRVYRHPMDKKESTSASYFALVGTKTLLGDNKKNARLHDVTDGTSNTLMIVEAKKDIPWTKPEDIAYSDDRTKAVPELGGWFNEGFLTVFGDGAVRLISKNIPKGTLQNLIERNDGQPINHEDLMNQPRPGRSGRPARNNPLTPAAPSADSALEGSGEAFPGDDESGASSTKSRGFPSVGGNRSNRE